MTITESIVQHGWTQKAYIDPSTGAMCMTAHAAESAGVDFSELEHSRQGEAITRLLVRTAPAHAQRQPDLSPFDQTGSLNDQLGGLEEALEWAGRADAKTVRILAGNIE